MLFYINIFLGLVAIWCIITPIEKIGAIFEKLIDR